jgi:uncharacterized protein HemX
MNKQKSTKANKILLNIGYVLLAVALGLGGYLACSYVQAESSIEQRRESRQQQQDQNKAAEESAIAEEEEKRQELEYLRCQVEVEKAFIATRDQIPAGYSTSQHLQMLQALEQKRSTDLDNCDRNREN